MRTSAALSLVILFLSLVPPRYTSAQAPPMSPSSAANPPSETALPRGAVSVGFGGPASVPAQVEEDRYEGPEYRFPGIDQQFGTWTDFKERLNEQHNLLLGMDYNSLYQSASESLTRNTDAASGIYRLYGDWTLFGDTDQSSGSLIFKGEHRHSYGTDVVPAQLGFEAGYLGIPGVLFNNNGAAITNLYWEQFLCNGKAGFVIGFLEPDSFIDVLGYANPWTAFQNFAVVVNPTIPFPDPVFGVAGGILIKDRWTLRGGTYDTNNTFGDFKFFPEGAELLSHLEIGWSPSRKERYLKEVHVAGWHSDARESVGVGESHGVVVAGNWTFRERWMPFFRAGWADGDAPFMQKAVTAGMIGYCPKRADLAGVAIAWGDPVDASLREQTTVECFYRIQVSRTVAITPSVQVLMDPAQNPNDNTLTFFGLRARLAI